MVSALSKYVDLHSYGSLFHNREEPKELEGLTRGERKRAILKRYKFVLAFENAVCKDYVTEKVYDGLLSGTLPIYYGAESVDKLLPGRNSIVKVSDFPDEKTLGEYIKRLAENQTLYDSYFNWKDEPPQPSFEWVERHSPDFPNPGWMCELCSKLASNYPGTQSKELMTC